MTAQAMTAQTILLLANAALGLFTELAQAYTKHADADQTVAQQLDTLTAGALVVSQALAAYRPIPKADAGGATSG